jgi:hypothetical protein
LFGVYGADGKVWFLEFRAPTGLALGPGTYSNVTRAVLTSPTGGIDFGAEGRGCDTVTGRFTIYQAEFDSSSNVRSFAADFEMHCESSAPAVYGAIRYDSAAPSVIPFGGNYSAYRLDVLLPQHGAVVGGPINCRVSEFSICSAGFATPVTLTLSAQAVDSVYGLTPWSGACSGTSIAANAIVDARNVLCAANFAAVHIVSFEASASPVVALQPVTWTAKTSADSGVEYEFWRYDSASGWHVVQLYSTTPTWSWTPGSADVGSHAIQVWVRAVGSQVTYEDWAGLSFDVVAGARPEITRFVADHAYPLLAGTSVTWTANASGIPAPEYEFWRLDFVGWHLGQLYSASNTYTWTPSSTDLGSHSLQVWVRNAGEQVGYEVWQSTTFNVIAPPLTVASLTASNTPGAGVTTTWTAQTSGGTAPVQYEFSLGSAGTHVLQVWVRNAGSAAEYDA